MGKGQKERRKGAVTMSLETFVAAAGKTSWADETENLPTEPSGRHEGEDSRSYSGGGFRQSYGRDDSSGRGGGDRYEARGSGRDYPSSSRSDRESRDPPQIPERPPFKAFVGNIPNETTEAQLAEFFTLNGCKVIRASIVKDFELNRSRGFGYVEFDDRDSMVKGLAGNGQELEGRALRVDISDSKPNDRNRGGSFIEEGGNEERMAGNWRDRAGAAPPPPTREDRYSRDSRSGGGFGDRYSDKESRSSAFGGGRSYERAEREERSYAAPTGERPKLNLKPRSIPMERPEPKTLADGAVPAAAPKEQAEKPHEESNKPNPFGSARPVDTATREAAIGKKLEELSLRSRAHTSDGGHDGFRGRHDNDSGHFERRDRNRDTGYGERRYGDDHGHDTYRPRGSHGGEDERQPERRTSRDQRDAVGAHTEERPADPPQDQEQHAPTSEGEPQQGQVEGEERV